MVLLLKATVRLAQDGKVYSKVTRQTVTRKKILTNIHKPTTPKTV
jgi:hypothetical protein